MDLFAPGHLLVIAVVAVVLFVVVKRLPSIGRSVGGSVRRFRSELSAAVADDTSSTSSVSVHSGRR